MPNHRVTGHETGISIYLHVMKTNPTIVIDENKRGLNASDRKLTAQAFCVKFFLANKHNHNWQPIHQNFRLRVAMDPIGQFGEVAKQEFNTKVSSAF